MKLAIVAVCFIGAVAMAAPSNSLRNLPALKYEEVRDALNQYHFRYVTPEGTIVEERGHLEQIAGSGPVLVIDGQTTYTAPDGKVYITKYHGGHDGFHAEGDHLPKSPEPETTA